MCHRSEAHWSFGRIRGFRCKVAISLVFFVVCASKCLQKVIVTRGNIVYVFRMLPPLVIVVLSSVAVLLLSLREAGQRVALSMSGL
jgi:hypothetical protein